MPDLTGGVKKSGLQVVQLCLKVSDQLILFAPFLWFNYTIKQAKNPEKSSISDTFYCLWLLDFKT